ncbi:ribonucleoside-triphosphate reductase [Thermus phage G20c]|nr:ribonucleoside-triphosphate reductase [Thermus phage G20c]
METRINPLGHVVYLRTYSRFLEDKQRRETWPETIKRVVDYSASLAKVEEQEKLKLYDTFLHLRGFPAGRTLWAGGTPFIVQNGQANYNCAFTDLRTGKDFYDLVILLMSGAGVGFRVTRDNIEALNRNLPIRRVPKLHVLPYEFYGYNHPLYTERSFIKRMGREATLVVGDSREGWAEAVKLFLELLGDGHVELLHVNLNSVRPLGSPLKRFGGFASGPGPLEDFFLNAAFLLGGTKPEGWTDVKALDVANLIGRMVVAGGTRRSAQIALGDWNSTAFVTAKTGTWWKNTSWRSQSNNSVIFHEKPDRDTLLTFFDYILQYGEPGFVNAQAALKRREDFRGLNPCLTGDTLVPVQGLGLVPIAELAGQEVPVKDENGNWVLAKCELTDPDAPILEVELSDGQVVKCTPWHEFVLADGTRKQAKDLLPGDQLLPSDISDAFGAEHNPELAYLIAWVIADGTWHNKPRQDGSRASKIYLYDKKARYLDRIVHAYKTVFGEEPSVAADKDKVTVYTPKIAYPAKDRIPDFVLRGDKETVLAFVEGYLSSDGTVSKTDKGWVVQFISIHRKLLEELQKLLYLLGVNSRISVMRKDGYRHLPDGNGGTKEYYCQTAYRLTVSNPAKLFSEISPDKNARGPYNVKRKISVVDVRSTNTTAPVFCFGVPTTNSFALPGFQSGNCAEILLRDKGVCNLTTVVLPNHVKDGQVDYALLEDTLRLLTRHAIRITMAQFPDVLSEWQRVQDEDRLIGVSFTGLDDFIYLTGLDNDALAKVLSWMRSVVNDEAKRYSAELGIPKPKLATTVKPEGTLSLLAGVSSGVHPAYAPYYIRRVRINKHDSVAQALRALGMEPKPEVGYDSLDTADVWVFEFPVKTNAKRKAHDYTAVEQLERYKLVNSVYTEHNTSITVYVAPEEKEEVVDWLLQNWDHYVAVSFLPKDDSTYPLMPFEAISEEEYNALVAKLPDFSALDEDVAFYDRLGGLMGDDIDPSCATGACPVR